MLFWEKAPMVSHLTCPAHSRPGSATRLGMGRHATRARLIMLLKGVILMGYRPVRRPRSGEPRSDLALGSCRVRKREWPLGLECFWLGGAFLRGWGCIWASFEASWGRIWASRGVAWKLIWASQGVTWQLIWVSLGWSGGGAPGPPARLRPGRFPQAGTRTFGGICSI